ncbi:MAG: hypothetical protein A2381_06635 [Bdellovibrionales bacterium RIFOXYB1_FULL_37_110]|nr:MAG: hypothetical protein A2181_08655 [Bdellovibrionales bacterium RIFOXYA1_FULL_38_20]OFZ50218.1 MAG: hypothetical protein A2417_19485 [Bdellovibrionales bacterium RIFOXYC1_FULL_37_79]OFZ57655.1 MAG: hypothetical protein A2381_06635 [Bdellovibrionales bacterium RIFOXYB1_FULL_37_110]OFZ61422.1 MAG: hypothetical protein A2577_01000 [Bdellovibrionales bacterium RIFOXYD1_FULL_36_51]
MVGYHGVKLFPYFIYSRIILNGIDSEYIRLDQATYEQVTPSYPLDIDDMENKPSDLFKNFAFGGYEVVVPVHHPVIKLLPVISRELDEKNLSLLGFKLITPQYSYNNISFEIQKTSRVSLNFYTEKLFTLSTFKKNILKRSSFEIWRDVYRLDLLYNRDLRSFNNSYHLARELSKMAKDHMVEELVYNLYILFLRQKIFENKKPRYQWYAKGGLGVMNLSSDNDLFKVEKLMFKEGDIVYSVILKTKKNDHFARTYRNMLFNTMRLKKSSAQLSQTIYEDYKTLSFEQKIDQKGMVYLFMAFSHVRENKNFLREMIQFLEKGKNNLIYLVPLYEYAFFKYGTNFSKMDKFRKETSEELLKRKIEEEKQKEIEEINRQEEKNRNNQTDDNKLIGDKTKVDYILEKLKEKSVPVKADTIEVD